MAIFSTCVYRYGSLAATALLAMMLVACSGSAITPQATETPRAAEIVVSTPAPTLISTSTAEPSSTPTTIPPTTTPTPTPTPKPGEVRSNPDNGTTEVYGTDGAWLEVNDAGMVTINGEIIEVTEDGLTETGRLLEKGERLFAVGERAVILNEAGTKISEMTVWGELELFGSELMELMVSLVEQGELATTDLSENVVLAWSAEAGAGEVVAIYEQGKGWTPIWNLTVVLDPDWRVELDTTTGQPVLKNAEGELLYVKNDEGVFEMVPSPTQQETMHSFHEAADYGMEVVDGAERYKEMITTLAEAPVNRDFWVDHGVSDPNYESVMALLRENDYMIDAKSPNGEYLSVVADSRSPTHGKITEVIPENDIVKFDFSSLRTMISGIGSVDNNIGNFMNSFNRLALDKWLIKMSRLTPPSEEFGIGFYQVDEHTWSPVWVDVNRKNLWPMDAEIVTKNWENVLVLSGHDLASITTNDEDFDGRLLTARWRAYWQYLLDNLDEQTYWAMTDKVAGFSDVIEARPRSVRTDDRLFVSQND